MTADTQSAQPYVGLALSGGGFRAAAFGLGCLRALHDTGVLSKTRVVSGISGGSLLTALWAYGPSSFEDFDIATVDLLRTGLQRELALRTLGPAHLSRRALDATVRRGGVHRNRTDVLAQVLARRAFGNTLLPDVTHDGVSTVLTATDLVSAKAVRFGSTVSSCSAHGQITDPVRVADAVAASAAFPILLPPMEREYNFIRNGNTTRRTVAMTDGGVFDNLGLSVLEPGRNPRFTDHTYPCDYVIACDAGRQEVGSSGARLFPRRLIRSFDITYRKTQDGSRTRLHTAGAAGEIRGFVHAYLGMRDERLPVPAPGLVSLERVNHFVTSFAAMNVADLAAVTTRGEQLTRLLLAHYCPGLLA